MKNNNTIQQQLGQTDIYLIDQILKDRYKLHDKILDAGCGNGRNMQWFLQNNFNMSGIDICKETIDILKNVYPALPADRFLVSAIEETIFKNNYFDHIICSAVLHFANNTAQFKKMIAELIRILKPGGTLFIRMTSNTGIENKVQLIADGVYFIPDGSKRFLLTKTLLADCLLQHNLNLIEPLKTVNVADIRCMSTLLLQKVQLNKQSPKPR